MPRNLRSSRQARTPALRRAATALTLGATLLTGLTLPVSLAGPAHAAPTTLAQKALQEAQKHQGKPYQYAAAGPQRFDCSGFTRYVFGRFGKNLPHNSAQQYAKIHKIPRSQMKPGDLVFIRSSGRIYHVGLYAGNGTMWHSPKKGDVVKRAKIFSSDYVVGRVT